MVVLVDFDNIEKIDRQRGLSYLLPRILDAVGAPNLVDNGRVKFRLYGGWFEGGNLSRRAQLLAAEIGKDYPTVIGIGGSAVVRRVRVTVELATTLVIDPKTDLLNTYRKNVPASNLMPRSRPWAACHSPATCPLSAMDAFFSAQTCPDAGCSLAPCDAFERHEQKLVDTMLTVDLVKLSTAEREPIIVVSSDDDMWPGIKSALLLGARVIHIHPKRGRTTPSHYCRNAGTTYVQASF